MRTALAVGVVCLALGGYVGWCARQAYAVYSFLSFPKRYRKYVNS